VKLKSRIERIPISSIVIPEERVRAYQDEESDMSLRSSIAKYGVLQPIIVRKRGDKYELIAGESRVKYAKQLGQEEIEARVYEDIPDADAILINLIENRARGALDPKEIVKAIDQLTEMGYSLREIAELTGFSYDYIKEWSRVKGMPEPLKQAVLLKQIDLRLARAIQSIPDEEKKMDAITTILTLPETVTYKEKLDLIEYYYKGKCDVCGREGLKVMKHGDKWMCEECLHMSSGGFYPPEEKRKETEECRICHSEYMPYEMRYVGICQDCLNRIEEIKRFFAFHMGYKWEELSFETLMKLVKGK